MRLPAAPQGQPERGADQGDEQEGEGGEGQPEQEHQRDAAGYWQPHQGQRGQASEGDRRKKKLEYSIFLSCSANLEGLLSRKCMHMCFMGYS